MNMLNKMKRRGSGANLNLFRYAAMVLVLLLGVGNAWGSTYYFAKVTLSTAGPTGAGSVYASKSTTQGSSNAVGATKSAANTKSVAFYGVAKPNSGYRFVNWTNTANCSFDDANKASNVKITVSTTQTSESKAVEGRATANFETIKVTAAPADVTINATDPSATYPDAAGVVVGFTTSSSNANSDFTIAYVHWGSENTDLVEASQRDLAKKYVAAGADLISPGEIDDDINDDSGYAVWVGVKFVRK